MRGVSSRPRDAARQSASDAPDEATEEVVRPPICVGIDQAIEEAGTSNRRLAGLLGTSEQNVGRWRNRVEPSRDTVMAIEDALGKPRGYVSRLAGYVDDDETAEADLLRTIETTQLLTDGYRRIMLRTAKEAIDASAEERADQVSWRATASAMRRSRHS